MAIIREYKPKLDENGLMILKESETYRSENKHILSISDAARILVDVFELDKEADENMLCICLDNSGKIIGSFRNSSGSNRGVHFDVGGIAKKVLAYECCFLHLGAQSSKRLLPAII